MALDYCPGIRVLGEASQATFYHLSLLDHYEARSSIHPHHRRHCRNQHELALSGSQHLESLRFPVITRQKSFQLRTKAGRVYVH